MYSSGNDTPRRPSGRPAHNPQATGRASSYNGAAPRGGYSTARPGYSGAQRPSAPSDARYAQRPVPARTAAPASANRRPVGKSRRFRRKNSLQPIAVGIAAALVLGLGVFGAVKLFSSLGGVPVEGDAASGSSASSVVEGVIDASDDVVTPPPVLDVKVAACYSDDAFVVEHLDVPKNVSTPIMLAAATDGSDASYSTEPVPVGSSGQENIAHWKTVNDDTVAWLKIPGTKINYPVVQGPSTSYYTEKGYDKNYSKNGVIWAAGDCKFGDGTSSNLSFNTVLYGHNWTNWSATPKVLDPTDEMFAQLTGYHHLWFAKSHPYIWFSTGNEEMLWQIFAVFYADTGFRYIDPDGSQAMLDGILARSEFIYDVPVSTSDKILTLSTCTQRFGWSRQQRFVVCAKLVSGVSEEQPSITQNPNPVRPKL